MRTKRHPLALTLLFAALVPAGEALAGTITITLTGTISSALGDFGGQVAVGNPISATIDVDDAVAGSFTPSPNPTFIRSEMLYSGAILSSTVTIDGQVVTGTGGDIRLLDAATGQLAGEDNYEVNVLIDAGSVGSATPVTVSFVGEYADATLTVSSGDPLPPPPAFDAGRFNPYTVTSSTGGTIFGQLDSLIGQAANAVPLGSPLGVGLLAGGLLVAARRGMRLSA